MKKMRLAVSLLAMLFLLAILFTGCGSSTKTSADSTQPEKSAVSDSTAAVKQLTIGLALATQQEERWVKESKAFKETAEKLGAKVVIQDAGNDENTQKNQIENLINQKVDAIVIVAANASTVGSSIESAKKAGIPVMTYSRLVKGVDYDCYVGFDIVDIGRVLAKAALEKVPKGNYMIINGDNTDNAAKLENQGYMEVLKPSIEKGDIKLVFEQWTEKWAPEKALAHAENALTQNKNNIDVAICSNDGMAGGVVQALKAQKLEGKVFVTGTDGETAALQRIAEGSQTCTLLFPSQMFAEKAAAAAVEMAGTKKAPANATGKSDIGDGKTVPTLFINTILVTKDNIKNTVVDSGFAKMEDVFKNVPKDQWPK